MQQIFSFYDVDLDNTLNYFEFMDLVISQGDYTLRRASKEKQLYDSSIRPRYISYNVEYSFLKLLSKEQSFVLELESTIKGISYCYDFDVYKLFGAMDIYGLSSITKDSYIVNVD